VIAQSLNTEFCFTKNQNFLVLVLPQECLK
jgi:hypothetical protein